MKNPAQLGVELLYKNPPEQNTVVNKQVDQFQPFVNQPVVF
jgi:hypothetical protein